MSKDRFNFRGLAKNNEWCYGSLLYYAGDAQIWDKDGNNYIVKPETVGQCTGLKDKNDNLIYEGDIVTYEWLESNGRCWKTDCKEIVKWNFGFVPIANIADYKIKNGTARNVQVIGNIYENKDLLERTTNE